MGVCTARNM